VYEIIFYQDKNGNQPILEYIQELTGKTKIERLQGKGKIR